MSDTSLHPRSLRAACLGLALLALPISTHAGDLVTLSLVSDVESVPPGGSLTVDVTASGLGNFSESSLGGFDLTLSFDPAIFELAEAVTGVDLGDPNLGEAIEVSTPGDGTYETLVFSVLTPAELIANQGDSLVLFSLYFDAIGLGSGAFDLELDAPLADELGNPLDVAPLEPLIVPVSSVVEVPTLDDLGLVFLIAILGLSALVTLRRNS